MGLSIEQDTRDPFFMGAEDHPGQIEPILLDDDINDTELSHDQLAIPDSITQLIRSSKKYPLLSAEDEVILAKEVRGGCRPAYERFFLSNILMVLKVAKKFQHRGVDFEDLISFGAIGLHSAVINFDETKGFRFSTYAHWWIRQAIQRGIADEARTIRIPVHMFSLFRKYHAIIMDHKGKGVQPSKEFLLSELGVDDDKLTEIQRIHLTTSLDTPIREDGSDMYDVLTDEDDESMELPLLDRNKKEYLEVLLSQLTPKERSVIRMRFYYGKTLEETGKMIGITRERIRQIEFKALRRLKMLALAQETSGEDL